MLEETTGQELSGGRTPPPEDAGAPEAFVEKKEQRTRKASEVKKRNAKLHVRNKSRFTLKRGEYRHEENVFLAEQFAEWFSVLTGVEVGTLEESFCKSLEDGIVLCRVMQHIEGSNLRKIHDPVRNPFQSRENIVMFQDACRRLGLPFVFKVSHIKDVKIDPVISCLLAVAKVAAEQEGFELPAAIKEKLEAMELSATQEMEKEETLMLEIPLDFATMHGITHLEVLSDGWVQRSPDSWMGFSWMEYGFRVTKLIKVEGVAAAAEEGEAGPAAEPENANEFTIYRRYNDFVCLSDMLVTLTRRRPTRLPPKTYTPHLTGSYVEGGSEKLQDRMKGLEDYIREDVVRKGQTMGYFGAVKRSIEALDGAVPDDDDQKTIAVVRRFFGIDDGWEQLVVGGERVPGGLDRVECSAGVHTIVLPSPHHD